MTKRKGKTTMQISETNHSKLKSMREIDESLDDVLSRILREVDKNG